MDCLGMIAVESIIKPTNIGLTIWKCTTGSPGIHALCCFNLIKACFRSLRSLHYLLLIKYNTENSLFV